MNRERLEKLACLLDQYQPAPGAPAFDLGTWGEYEERRGGFLWLRKNECGTAACAVGLACFSKEFAAEGLRYRRVHGLINPVFGMASGWDAAKAFFGLTEKQADRLFASGSYPISSGPDAATAVAKRIRTMTAPRKRKVKRVNPTGMAILEDRAEQTRDR
jgi:hypothetical protein